MSEKKRQHYGAVDDMLAAFLITYAFAALSFEKYMPESFVRLYRAAVFIVFAATWLGLSFKSGRRAGRKFPIFAVLFWIVPPIVIWLADNGPEVFRMSIIMYVLSEFMNFFTTVPSEVCGTAVGISAPAAVAVILLLCGVAYMSGYFMYTFRQSKKGNYT